MFAISPTDHDWFKLLKTENFIMDINFWTPTPWNVSGLKRGDRFYFMLKAPIRKIGGYGEFAEYVNLSVEDAWNKFGLRNGCASKEEFVQRMDKYKSKNSKDERSVLETEIGCIVLTNVDFFEEKDYIDLDTTGIDFSKNIVKLKYFHETDSIVKYKIPTFEKFELLASSTEKIRKSRLSTERCGQGGFRKGLNLAYSDQCCVTGESIAELLEGAHIQPYLNEKSNSVQNGLLLRIDLHKLYDNGLIYIDNNYTLHVSNLIKSQYYQAMNGKQINLPRSIKHYPSKEALESRKKEFRYE